MMRKITQRYVLGKREKEIIEAWLNDEIPASEAGAFFKMTATNFKSMVASVMKQLVADGAIDITKPLKDY